MVVCVIAIAHTSMLPIQRRSIPLVRKYDGQKGCDCVATKSVLKNIDIKNRQSALALVNALENAKGKHTQHVVKTRTFSDANREEIRKMFGATK